MILSVLINNYNYGRYLDECIQSLQQQTYKNFEVILYDDGSSDNSIEIARKYSFVKIISNNNFGKFPSFNQANAINQSFALSKGDVICLLDSDDFFSNDKLEKIYQAFYSNDAHKAFYHSHSYTANPLACAAENASMKLLEQNQSIFKIWTEHNY